MPTVLESAPRLGPLYVKAALGAIGPRGRELPATELVREDVAVDRAHLAEYAHVCGFAVADALPATYPHVLAFPLQVALMAGRDFPLPLPGLVHVRNTITVHRRIDAAERLTVRVHAERLVAHPKGAQVDLVAPDRRRRTSRSGRVAAPTWPAARAPPDAGQPRPAEPTGVGGRAAHRHLARRIATPAAGTRG